MVISGELGTNFVCFPNRSGPINTIRLLGLNFSRPRMTKSDATKIIMGCYCVSIASLERGTLCQVRPRTTLGSLLSLRT
ncbi:unnamed protein product, partial [Dicrocoelium dendriticum]